MKINFLNFLPILLFSSCTSQKNLSYLLTEKEPISQVVTPKGDTIFKFKDPRSGETVRYTTKDGKLVNEWGELIIVEKMPEFPTGTQAMFQFFYANLRYPRIALDHGAQATVTVCFIVQASGVIDSAYVKDMTKIYNTNSAKKRKQLEETIPETCYDAMKAETLRLIEAMPNWKPGMQQNRPVRVKFTMPVNFRIN